MKYNSKYDRYVTKGGMVYRYDSAQDKLILCKLDTNGGGYLRVFVTQSEKKYISVHRIVYETFIGEIPDGYQIDHINTIKTDNRLENLRLVTPKENMSNPLTIKHLSESKKGKVRSEFGEKFKKHFSIYSYENRKLYDNEYQWYRYHNNKCRWEV